MSGPLLMTFNASSSSVKIGLFSMDGDRVERIAHALIDFRHRPLTFPPVHPRGSGLLR